MAEAEAVFAVYIEHEASVCPAADKERGARVARNLREAELTGVFIPPHHKGVWLAEGMSEQEILEAYDQVLPDHLPPQLAQVVLDAQVTEWLTYPDVLDGTAAQRTYLRRMDDVHPGHDLLAPMEDPEIPTRSLRLLPQYIEQKIAKL